jgi:hypothetical protein
MGELGKLQTDLLVANYKAAQAAAAAENIGEKRKPEESHENKRSCCQSDEIV